MAYRLKVMVWGIFDIGRLPAFSENSKQFAKFAICLFRPAEAGKK